MTQHFKFKRNIKEWLRDLSVTINYEYYDITTYLSFFDNTKETKVRRGQENQKDPIRESLIGQQPT